MSFASHSLKASTRLVVNSSPEPFSNIAVSTGENVMVVGVVALLWHYPVAVFLFLCSSFRPHLLFPAENLAIDFDEPLVHLPETEPDLRRRGRRQTPVQTAFPI